MISRGDFAKLSALLVTSVLAALLVLQVDPIGADPLKVGDLAPTTLKAPRGFSYDDRAEESRRIQAATDGVRPVYVYRKDRLSDLRSNTQQAFAEARAEVAGQDGAGELKEAILSAFRERLGVAVSTGDLQLLYETGFSVSSQRLAESLLVEEVRGYIVRDITKLPAEGGITVLAITDLTREERTVDDLDDVLSPEEVRARVRIRGEQASDVPAWSAVTSLIQSMVRSNLRFSEDETVRRKQVAAGSVGPVQRYVQKGTLIFLGGEILTAQHITQYEALQVQSTPNIPLQLFCFGVLFALLLGVIAQFGVKHAKHFELVPRNLISVCLIILSVGVFAKLLVAASESVSLVIGYDCTPQAIWFAVPVAGGAVLVRLLCGSMWSVLYSLAGALLCTLIMDVQSLYFLYFTLTAMAGASAVHHTRERLAVLKAGLSVGAVGAALALFVTLIQGFLLPGQIVSGPGIGPVWAVVFGFAGGVLSSFFVLALMPVFENFGYVTDYRMMELASLNHPLMKQLMLRAPGSYHHSIVVGTLAEAACDAVGANSLQAKVASYFHDIGKAVKPQYFIENNRDGQSRHNGLDPNTSSQIIIQHVKDGAKLAAEHRLPQPIVDNILMHHGDGLLSYFYNRAVENAECPEDVSIEDFRYPGPKPNSREAGIIMLADKVEAATRTIVDPTEDKFRRMISSIINSVLNDGQFQNCPLTFQEIYMAGEAFVGVLMGIHHQRIEYPHTASLSRKGVAPPKNIPNRVITLEIPSGSKPAETHQDNSDYESVEHLPRG